MRTRNPNYVRALDTSKGRVSPRNAGSRGITFRDATTEAQPVRDLLVVGGTITDNNDGTAILTVGPAPGTPVGTFGGGNGFSIDGMVPYAIPDGEEFVVPLYKQALFHMTIDVVGTLTVDGYLIEVA